MAPDFFGILWKGGLRGRASHLPLLSQILIVGSYCDLNGMMSGTNGFWMWLFMLSKLAEFTDTFFIVRSSLLPSIPSHSSFRFFVRNLLCSSIGIITFSLSSMDSIPIPSLLLTIDGESISTSLFIPSCTGQIHISISLF